MEGFKIYSLDGRSEISVDVGPETTLLELRYQLFSLTEIPPESILLHFANTTRHPNDELDENPTLSSLGITSTTRVSYSDSAQSLPPATAGPSSIVQPKALKPPQQKISVNDVKAALQYCSTQNLSPGAGPSSATSSPPDRDTEEFLEKVRSYHEAIVTYEDKKLQEKARAVMPLQTLQTKARERHKTDAKYPTYEQALAKELLHWFKNEFFTWLDTPICWACGKKTDLDDILQPSEAEMKYQASRTELFVCTGCGAETRFPRYNNVSKLLETRRGRCGEWVQAFTLIVRAAGLRVRSVHDWTDHVWTEIWCGRWVHADCCEDVLDEPLLYESGWKKNLNYCIATGVDSVADVTRRYTRKFEGVRERRTLANEGLLQGGLKKLNTEALVRLDKTERVEAVRRYEEDMMALAKAPEQNISALPGRQSGSTKWVQSRGEDGSGQ